MSSQNMHTLHTFRFARMVSTTLSIQPACFVVDSVSPLAWAAWRARHSAAMFKSDRFTLSRARAICIPAKAQAITHKYGKSGQYMRGQRCMRTSSGVWTLLSTNNDTPAIRTDTGSPVMRSRLEYDGVLRDILSIVPTLTMNGNSNLSRACGEASGNEGLTVQQATHATFTARTPCLMRRFVSSAAPDRKPMDMFNDSGVIPST